MIVSVVVFREWLESHDGGEVAVVFRTDNTATIQAALQFQASSPIMMQLCAELSLLLETTHVSSVMAQHVPGTLNVICDALSRLSQGAQFPSDLEQCKCLSPPKRDESFYMAWPEVQNRTRCKQQFAIEQVMFARNVALLCPSCGMSCFPSQS